MRHNGDLLLTLWDFDGSSVLLSEIGSLGLHSSVWLSESGSTSSVQVAASLWHGVSSEVSDAWSGSSFQSESSSCWGGLWVMSRLVFFFLGWDVFFLWDQIINAFFVFHLQLFFNFIIK
jgi:hypothetical protein